MGYNLGKFSPTGNEMQEKQSLTIHKVGSPWIKCKGRDEGINSFFLNPMFRRWTSFHNEIEGKEVRDC